MSDATDAAQLTIYLRRWREGDRAALDLLMPRVYEQMRAIARRQLRRERPDHTLDSSGLVHEAYLRIAAGGATNWQDRAHFFSVAAQPLRRILIDHAKERLAQKRGGGRIAVELDSSRMGEAGVAAEADPHALMALDEALTKQKSVSPRQAKAVELRYSGGLTLEEAAAVLGTSAPTVMRDLRFAQAWMGRAMEEQ